MATKRATNYGHSHSQRRPPDVEEALSSMLWTPYERASNTDTSSEDEDDLHHHSAMHRQQLRKSKSQYDYTSVPTIPPPSPIPSPSPRIMRPASAVTNLVAYIPTPTHLVNLPPAPPVPPIVATSNCLLAIAAEPTSSYYGTDEICDASVTTPLVPFSSLVLGAQHGHLTAVTGPEELVAAATTTTTTMGNSSHLIAVAVEDAHNNCYPNESTLASNNSNGNNNNTMSSSFAASLESHKNRCSYPSYGRIAGLSKWFSSSSSSNSHSSTTANSNSLPAPHPSSSTNNTATVTLPASSSSSMPSSSSSPSSGIAGSMPLANMTMTTTASEAKEPPSYESLYSKQQQQQQKQEHQRTRRRHVTRIARHSSKHLNIFKPVLETLKANVSTITQGRFSSITSSSTSAASSTSSSTFLARRQDNSRRVNTNTSNNINNANVNNNIGSSSSSTQRSSNSTGIGSPSNNPLRNVGNSCESTNNGGCVTSIGTHLVHSFSDDFLTERASSIHCNQQHVATINVDNEHIVNTINNNNSNSNNNNNNVISCSITTINESTEPAVQLYQQQQQHQQTHSDNEAESEEALIHQRNQLVLVDHDQNTQHKKTNTISQQTEEQEQTKTENKQNNNFIWYHQQRPLQHQPQHHHHHNPHHEHTHQMLYQVLGTSEIYDQSMEYDKMNPLTTTLQQMNAYTPKHFLYNREPREFMYSVYCHSRNSDSNALLLRGELPPYETTALPLPISLTRSFEVNTSYGGGLSASSHPSHFYNTADTFKTSFVGATASKKNTTSGDSSNSSSSTTNTNTETTTTYNLTPNKCLAELERLYAEFRASESLREKRLRETQGENVAGTVDSCENTAVNMRLNVPAAATGNGITSTTTTTSTTSSEVCGSAKNNSGGVDTTNKVNPSTSSVFLTTTNSVTALTNPCQRTPSLTIQVNQNPSHTNVNNAVTNDSVNNNNNNNVGEHASQIHLNQAIVNSPKATTTMAKNGVSVINCNYVNNSSTTTTNNDNNNTNNNSNNNNNNRSITNLSDMSTNTNLNISYVNSSQVITTNPPTPTKRIKSGSSNGNSDNSPSKNNRNRSDIHGNGGGKNSNTTPSNHSSVPKVLNIENNNNANNENTKNNQVKNANGNPTIKDNSNGPNTSVNVIQINGQTTSPSRTFTSTECQTDDLSSVQLRSPRSHGQAQTPSRDSTASATLGNNRDQRRRERRERRHLHHTASMMVAPTHSHHPGRHSHLDRHSMPAPPLPPILHPPHLHPGLVQNPHNVAMMRPMLPDILHNHYPPPYSALPSQPPPPPPTMGVSASMSSHPNATTLSQFTHACPPPPPTAGVTLLGPPPPPPPAGTTMLTSVISTVPIPGATPMVNDGRFTLPLPIMRRSPSERSGKGCCGQWFAGPPLRALIAVVALGGVACALGGAALGATGLAGPPSSHFTAALLMIGVGVVLVTVSGAAWRMTAPGGPQCLGLGSSVDLGRCGRRPCSRGGGAPQGLLYPEFQHRPPPPSYQASMQEYRLRLLLLDRDRQNGVVRGSSPPPTYRSHAGSLLRAPLTSTIRGVGGIGLANATGRAESSIGGSEYSFPPSYRSRNTTPGTISSERSIETEPSGRLLANEDIPEPLSVEQLSEYNTLQQRTMQRRLSSTPATQLSLTASTLTTTSAATTIPAMTSTNSKSSSSGGGEVLSSKTLTEEKRNSLQLDRNCIISQRDTSSDKKDDLVTIVTITPPQTTATDNNNAAAVDTVESQNTTNLDMSQSGSREQLEILAHL
ncbi:uncharacterized protein LOC142238680 [Haematobia irritans]|uniref:uncharacterized protein LOC142238680 n=1 Tax=Haematobia irritans TaxID=7368 RepID=UPI003F5021FB